MRQIGGSRRARGWLRAGVLIPGVALALHAHPGARATAQPAVGEAAADTARFGLVPWPASVDLSETERFSITKNSVIEVSAGQPALRSVAERLVDLLQPALGTALSIREGGFEQAPGAIRLEIEERAADQPGEGYELAITAKGIRISAGAAAGVFYGTQTLRQLLPYTVELRGARPHELAVPIGRIADRPRYAWRGAMLDVARHFFEPADVKRFIDLLALYKLNRLHLHLSDDQGWRIEIAAWPNLTTHGGSTEVGGGPGGFYTKQEYAELVAYARDRFITIVPEIDMPGHTNAALASYPELNCDGTAPPLYAGIRVGFTTLCVEKDLTYTFVDDVVREIAAMTPGPYFHIGGDEVQKLTPEEYGRFVERAQDIVQKHGKTAIGWDEILHAPLRPDTIAQHWRPDSPIDPPAGTKLILSPANKVYLDMKYDETTPIGLTWAGQVSVRTSYEWDPAALLPDVPEPNILGVEAPLWSETVATMADVEFLAFPRLAAVSEVAWSPQASRAWAGFRDRLGAQAPRWSALGVNAYRSPEVDWR